MQNKDITPIDPSPAPGQALQRLLDHKGPVRRRRSDEQAFLEVLDEVLSLIDTMEGRPAGWLDGSVSRRRWQDYMDALRDDLLDRLNHYRAAGAPDSFCPASLTALREERYRAERTYIRALVQIYHKSAQTYKSLCG